MDRIKNVGVTSTLRNMVSVTPVDETRLMNACWLGMDGKGL